MFRLLALAAALMSSVGCSTSPPQPAAQSQAAAQSQPESLRYRAAVVGLTDDAELRALFERSLVEKALAHDYDALTSYDIVPDISAFDAGEGLQTLSAHGVQAVLMLRPAAIGAGASLESVREEVSPELYHDMEAFAAFISTTGADDLIVVVHMAVYVIESGEATLMSSGAVWLDEPVEDQAEGIERLQDIIVANVDAVRPAIRRRLGLPPLN
jgi:hypothetical protein